MHQNRNYLLIGYISWFYLSGCQRVIIILRSQSKTQPSNLAECGLTVCRLGSAWCSSKKGCGFTSRHSICRETQSSMTAPDGLLSETFVYLLWPQRQRSYYNDSTVICCNCLASLKPVLKEKWFVALLKRSHS